MHVFVSNKITCWYKESLLTISFFLRCAREMEINRGEEMPIVFSLTVTVSVEAEEELPYFISNYRVSRSLDH